MQLNSQQSVSNVFKQFETPAGAAESGARRTASGNFGASNPNEPQNDEVSITGKVKKEIKQNWLVSLINDTFKAASSKKFLISVGLTLLTTIGLAYIGNKSSDKMAELGIAVDKKLQSMSLWQSISKGAQTVKNSIKDFFFKLFPKTANDIADTFKNRHAQRRWNILGNLGGGFKPLFELTPPDVSSKAFIKEAGQYDALRKLLLNQSAAQKALSSAKGEAKAAAQQALDAAKNAVSSLVKDSGFSSMQEMMKKTRGAVQDTIQAHVGKGRTAVEITNSILGVSKMENADFAKAVSEGIRKQFGCKNNEDFLKVLMQLKQGKKVKDAAGNLVDPSKLINVYMSDGRFSPVSNWWHVNLFNKAVSFFTGKPQKNCLGNFYDSLIKANVVEGNLADTAIGRLVQKSITVPTESISNHVNDKSGLGAFLCAFLMKPLFDKAQDAPKGKKASTVADDFAGTIGSIAIATPLAAGTTYGLATLGNLKGDSWITKLLKIPGRLFNMGLDKYAKDGSKIAKQGTLGGFSGAAGGAMRFVLIAGVFSAMFSKPIRKVIHKIFGKPYDPAEEQRKLKQQEAEKQLIAEYQKYIAEMQKMEAQKSINKRKPAGNTNVLTKLAPQKKMAALPASQQYYAQHPEMMPYSGQYAYYQQMYPQSGYNMQQMINSAPQQQRMPLPADNSAIAASNLGEAEKKTEEELYVPSSEVDNTYFINEEKKINERTSRLLKSADAKIGRITKALQQK